MTKNGRFTTNWILAGTSVFAGLWGLAAPVLFAALAAMPARADMLQTVAVEDSRLTGEAGDGRKLAAADLIGTTFRDGSFTYAIVGASADPFLHDLWRYRVTWKANDNDGWRALCRNSRGSTGWAYAITGSAPIRFVCEDTAMARCLAQAGIVTAVQAMDRCIAG
ncbi:MAG: hypothetical protein PHS60_03705 [Zavarzinia sp.]|nr:hypothetical protein [Zavarzinia sp.]